MRAAFAGLCLFAWPLYAAPGPLFETPAEERLVLDFQKSEKARFGAPEHIQRYNALVTGNTLLMQRSGRKRLFDHNIFLRAVFQGQILLADGQPLSQHLNQAHFIDIGSGILYGDGAPTVRDIFEDAGIRPHLAKIVATDIDDPASPNTRYISQYRAGTAKLPFPVEQVPMTLDTQAEWEDFLYRCAKGSSGLVLRAVNTGPDLFYTETEIVNHFSTLAAAAPGSVLYLFSKFVIWKPAGKAHFQVLGEMDPAVGTVHGYDAWLFVDWDQRTIQQAFTPLPGRASIRNQRVQSLKMPNATSPAIEKIATIARKSTALP